MHFFNVLGESHQLSCFLETLEFTLLVSIVLGKCSFEFFIGELGESVLHHFFVSLDSVFCPKFLGVRPLGPLDNNLTFVIALLLEIKIALCDVLEIVVLDGVILLVKWFTEAHLMDYCATCLPLLQLLLIVQLIVDLQTTGRIVAFLKMIGLVNESELLRF